MGFTDVDLANLFEVAPSTLYLWKTQYPEFSEAISRSKDELDAAVEQSLYRRATGYDHKAVKIFQHDGEALEVPYTEHYPPDPTSMIFWLKNRQPQRWRDRQEITGPDGGPIQIEHRHSFGALDDAFGEVIDNEFPALDDKSEELLRSDE